MKGFTSHTPRPRYILIGVSEGQAAGKLIPHTDRKYGGKLKTVLFEAGACRWWRWAAGVGTTSAAAMTSTVVSLKSLIVASVTTVSASPVNFRTSLGRPRAAAGDGSSRSPGRWRRGHHNRSGVPAKEFDGGGVPPKELHSNLERQNCRLCCLRHRRLALVGTWLPLGGQV